MNKGYVVKRYRTTVSYEMKVDDTLTVTEYAADAKKTGDEIAYLNDELGEINGTLNGKSMINYTEGKNLYVNNSTHSIVNDPDACISELIPSTWWDESTYGRFYYNDIDGSYYYVFFYDSNQEYISYRGIDSTHDYRSAKGFENTAYVQFSFKKGTVGKITDSTGGTVYWEALETIISEGIVQEIGDLSALETVNKNCIVDAINEINESITESNDLITPEKTTFFNISKNLIDPDSWINGQYVNQVTGIFVSKDSHRRTNFIPVKPNTSYEIIYKNRNVETQTRYAFYKEPTTASYIPNSGAVENIPVDGELIVSPDEAAYLVMSNSVFYYSVMLAETDELIEFEDYDNAFLLPQYIREQPEIVPINIPSKIYATEGIELNIYFENITEDWTRYDWDITCTKGEQWSRGYKITPVAGDAGTYVLTITATDINGYSSSKSVSLVITAASSGSGVSKSVIVLGDSTTNNGVVITKLNENFTNDVMSILTLGTRGSSLNNHEGRSGWTLNSYFTTEYVDYTDGRGHVENPFYNPNSNTFDANYYFTHSGIAKPDWFFINMGINDVFGYYSDEAVYAQITTCINYIELIITSIKNASADTKIGVCLTIPPNHSQDAFGKAYGNTQTRNRYKRNNTLWVNKLIEVFDDRESEKIYLIPIHTNLDTVYNMGMETLPVNARNTVITYQSPIANGGVHPVESGYWQIADVYTAFLKAQV